MENTINTPEPSSLFTSRTGKAIWADALNTPVAKMLFSEFWNEGELAVLFGNGGIGKSLLAVQVADAIAAGKPVNGFTTEVPAQKVLYFDFATSDRQFARRYEGYSFSDNLIRVTLNPRHWELRKFGEQLVTAIESAVKEHGAKVIIIDSLSTLKFFVNEIFLLSALMRLKIEMNLSILLVAGTKKMKEGRPLRPGNLAAHKMLAGVADSLFAMGVALPEGENRYLIHLKGNEHGEIYHRDNVVMGRNTVTGDFPGFEFMGYGTEQELLSLPLPADGAEAKIMEYRSKAPYASLAELAKWTGTNKMKVKRVLDRYSSKPEPQSGGRESAIPPTDSRLRGNDRPPRPETPATLTTNPFRGEVGKSNPTSHQAVKVPVNTAVTTVTPNSEIKNPEPATPVKQLTYSQQLKKRLAQARKQR